MSAEGLPIHWLSKEARFRIIELMSNTRSIKELAEQLEVSRTMIRKYLSRKTHPSDLVLEKALNHVAEYEKEAIVKIVIDDIVNAVELLRNTIVDNERCVEYLKYRLNEVLKRIG